MAGYFKVQIKEGLVSNLTCPEEKCGSQALPNQVKLVNSCIIFTLVELFRAPNWEVPPLTARLF